MAEMREKLSAMFDGDVDEATARALFARLKCDVSFRGEWDAYCLAGDAIRDGVQTDMSGFTARVMARIGDEPTIFAPRPKENETGRRSLRHWLLPVAASVMGVLAVGGVVAALSGGGAVPSVQVASSPPPSPPGDADAGVAAPVAHRATDGARRDYLMAHQAMAGGPMPAAVQYIRTISASTEE
ncbi:MAG: sigma-E factor negative regulatory protein [Azoarcus sp.]|jgi:sigma-E factor negative regulatory protein RseA|nr:sigma-E factor negative regulatory protein [Azoarcus sp.]